MHNEVVRVRAGIDVGNATTIAAASVNDAPAIVVTMPTQKTLTGARLVAPRGPDDHILAYVAGGNVMPVFVGNLAVETGDGMSDGARGSKVRYSDGWTIDFILAALSAVTPKAQCVEAEIAVSVPAELYSDALASEIARRLTNAYSYQYGGKPRETIISAVMVERECYAAMLAIDPAPIGRVLGIDIGGGTINLAEMENGALLGVKTIYNVGNEYILDEVDRRIIEQGGRALTKIERRRLLAALRDGCEYSIIINNQSRRVDELARILINGAPGYAGAVASFVSTLQAKVDISAYSAIYLIGGAARDGLWGKRLKELLPPVVQLISDDPESDNARGLLTKAGGRILTKRQRRK